jgi:putative acetyltransferase
MMRGVDPAIAVESPLQDDVRALIAELNDVLHSLTPPEFCYHMKPEEMAEPHTTVFVARFDGRAVAMGALRRHPGNVGEVKRMYTRPEAQGRGIGGAILAEIEALARRERLAKLLLETGDRHPAAWRVYERGGFTRCDAFLDYPDTGWSVFYEKALVGASAPARATSPDSPSPEFATALRTSRSRRPS